MQKFKSIFVSTLVYLSIFSCNHSNVKIIELQIPKTSIPEGISVHPTTKEIYVSSIHHDILTKSSPNGKNVDTILSTKDNGYSIGVGLDIWRNKLYALSSYKREKQAILSIKDLSTNHISTLKLDRAETSYFNDLAIDSLGNAYITDTQNSNIYVYNKSKNIISLFITNEDIKFPNGIAISSDNSKLFIDSYTQGIRIVDIKTKVILNDKHDPTIKKGIDGLKYYNGALYLIINGATEKEKHGLFKLALNSDETKLSELIPILVNHSAMDIPTTFSIRDHFAYILANSQMDKLDQENNEIRNKDDLKKTNVIKLKLH